MGWKCCNCRQIGAGRYGMADREFLFYL